MLYQLFQSKAILSTNTFLNTSLGLSVHLVTLTNFIDYYTYTFPQQRLCPTLFGGRNVKGKYCIAWIVGKLYCISLQESYSIGCSNCRRRNLLSTP
jgi:hypothetical protein